MSQKAEWNTGSWQKNVSSFTRLKAVLLRDSNGTEQDFIWYVFLALSPEPEQFLAQGRCINAVFIYNF